MQTSESLSLNSRARGMLVGLAVGDALGAPVEFGYDSRRIAELGDKIEHFLESPRLPKGVWTDDTEMSLCLADSLLECNGYDSYDIMHRYQRWMTEGYRTPDGAPAADVGNQTARAIVDYRRNPVIRAGTVKEQGAGNAPIMRLAPIVLASTVQDDLAAILELARLSCRETHNSIAAEAVTEMFATALFFAMRGESKQEIADHFADHLSNEAYRDFYQENRYALIGRAREKDGSMLYDLGGYIVDAFAIAFWALLNFDNFKDGMLAVVRLSGDTDTNAAIYGQLAGAYYGFEAIPSEWRQEVYLADELIGIADKLVSMPKCEVIRTRFEDERNFKEAENE